ncbi:MAG: hypothetical protein B7Z60_04250 [Ferrovum sp. 37-45-19]|jgi:hypothetical protein|uniref:outer membrane beta-barrel protein n=1 Tax=Ferrovum sp. JA12 TaxID=1356299 RepID=UPI0007029113|nr:outer membrane beta-barrel protein [Ferrovum sp. JA12]OYV79559.1 MAG: hypothetical protein B7Z65_05250 [Ferrovum sp. 21-44-67]OYV94646.1 MAG: hypothetical protein B7Z60_04250 [Ferrovum sp. 37-45-19]OZB34532.1 MAG: hypothetical protein B7X47_00550 [Ferrovum sp. 34-44-207]HQT81479.1 outer membrane beta-barrel protein [Ferrovaceae bacterium]KRH79448.1 hypothetical protein FERRO_05140 [Ferrovum sp. JA12]
MKKQSLIALMGLIFSVSPKLVYADGTAAPAADANKPTLETILTNSGITDKEYIDASYIGHNQTPNTNIQVIDPTKSSFGLHQLGVVIAKQPKEGFGGLVNVIAGSDAGVICSYGICTNNTAQPFSGGSLALPQAFIQYAKGDWTTILGKFPSLAGAESFDSTLNTNMTRSILYNHQPFTHTGIRIANALTSSTTLTVGVNNGWDQATAQTGSKTFELALNETFTPDTSLVASIYSGAEAMPQVGGTYSPGNISPVTYTTNTIGGSALLPTNGGRSGLRNIYDTVFTTNLTSQTTFIVDADYVTQQNAALSINTVGTETYWGIAAYLNHQFNDQYRVSLRAEQLRDEQGVAIAYSGGGTPLGANTVREVTVTLGYAPIKNFELRTELRADRADNPIFGTSNGSLTQNMLTYGMQGIYKF